MLHYLSLKMKRAFSNAINRMEASKELKNVLK